MSEFVPYPGNIQHPWLQKIVLLMDQYREVRLLWTVLDFMVGVAALGLVIWLIYRVRQINREVQSKQEEITGLVNSATKSAKDTNRHLVAAAKQVKRPSGAV
jgi:hypothetical protein